MANDPLCLTMGDPAGIGPELAAKAWMMRQTHAVPPFFLIGARKIFKPLQSDCPLIAIDDPAETLAIFDRGLPILEYDGMADFPDGLIPGRPDKAFAPFIIKAIEQAVDLVMAKKVAAIITNPIHKQGLYSAGFKDPGHTEFLARLAGLPPASSVMMLAVPGLRVVPLTIHVPLNDVATHISADKIIAVAKILHQALSLRFGIEKPRIAVAGLNPHAGEGGTIGGEEESIIRPAITALRQDGLLIEGPFAADSLFHIDARKTYDAVLCMYHDQALIPLKTIDFYGGVNITLGLPFLRTSPDHGTAFDLAGHNKARPDSLIAAIKMAARLNA
ncbi:4-hydroxythreonine-4-phosphate dehydrogenase [alpha proteobacterium Q-1]|nr:4-hydroxythreonine-4-phosphate dehydrogenase [alpha proteobacterium Q-1]